MQSSNPSLYGLTESNSSRKGKALWGKNQFNSTFPVALCLFMRDQGVGPVAVTVRGGKIVAGDGTWTMADVVGKKESLPFYHFEKEFTPYEAYSRNVVEKIDLVVGVDGSDSMPLEIKLTVIPDISTAAKGEEDWAPEMVIRPVSSAHAMMGVARSLDASGNEGLKQEVVEALKPTYNAVSGWENAAEILKNASGLRDALSAALAVAVNVEKPFLIQPIWKTEGQSIKLKEQCFDVFVWSDVAVMQIPVDMTAALDGSEVSRHLREVARHVRALYDILSTGDHDYQGTYGGMALGNQTDKSFALSGQVTKEYLKHPRLLSPHFGRDVLQQLILNGGEQKLRPERRFDLAVALHMTQGLA